jgi:hypothetical protein
MSPPHGARAVAALPGSPPGHSVGGYARPPSGGSGQGLQYRARSTHRVAIAPRRLLALEAGRVTFRWQDDAHGNRQRLLTLDAVECIRRCLLPILPAGCHRLRHYGVRAHRGRQAKLGVCRVLLQQQSSTTPPVSPAPQAARAQDQPAAVWPACQRGRMSWGATRRFPPALCARWRQPPGWDTA